MKKLLGWLLIIILIPISYLLVINKSKLDIEAYKYLDQFNEQKKARQSGVSFSIILTGTASSLEALVVKGGSLFSSYKLSHSAIFIKHPKGNILFDTGLGRNIDEQYENEMPSELKPFMKYEFTNDVLTQLNTIGFTEDSIDLIIPSHLHWDHVSGLEDFINTEIFITREEKVWANLEGESFNGSMKSQFDDPEIKWNYYEFAEAPYENFDKSYDLFGDGSIILLPIEGHTPGSVALLLTTHYGEKYLFTGDLSWSLKGLELPAEKFSISADIADDNQDLLKESLARVYYLKKRYPELLLVPAHDYEVQKRMGFFPKFIK